MDVAVEDIGTFEKELFEFIDTKYSEIPELIKKDKEITDKTEELLIKAIKEYKVEFANN